jgi:regulator of sigma E protease
MLYGFLAVLALGVLIIVHEWGHYIVAKLCNMRVDRFAIGFGPAILQKQRGETTFQVGVVPLGGFVQIAGMNPEDEGIDTKDPRSYPNRPAWQRFLTIAAGPGVNYIFAAFLIFLLHAAIGVHGVVVRNVLPNLPAAAVGMQAGDQLFRIDGHIVSSQEHVKYVISTSGGKALQIEVVRGGERKALTIAPAPSDDHKSWRIGVEMEASGSLQRHSLLDSARQSLVEPMTMSVQTLSNLADVIRGRQSADFKSPVGIARIMKEQLERGLIRGLQFIAMISTLLGLFNLLPLPALDGGRLVFLGWEVITRRPVNQRVEQIIHLVGMLLLLGLLVILMVKDVRDWIFGH